MKKVGGNAVTERTHRYAPRGKYSFFFSLSDQYLNIAWFLNTLDKRDTGFQKNHEITSFVSRFLSWEKKKSLRHDELSGFHFQLCGMCGSSDAFVAYD